MGLTKSLCCRRLSFTDTASCPHCGKSFPEGELQAKAVAADNAFERKAHWLFLAAFVTLPLVLFFLEFNGYLNGSL